MGVAKTLSTSWAPQVSALQEPVGALEKEVQRSASKTAPHQDEVNSLGGTRGVGSQPCQPAAAARM